MPRVLDKSGRELSAGDPVIMPGFGAMPAMSPLNAGTVKRFSTVPQGVEVEWPDADTTCLDWYPVEFTGTDYRCNDLELVETTKEAAAAALTEGEK